MNHCILKYIQCYHSIWNVCGTIYPDIPVYSCTQRIFSSCTRPAGPAEIRESAPATVLTLGTQVQAQSSCLLSSGFRSGRGGRRPQRRPQRRSPWELAEPSPLMSWQLAAPTSGSMIWTTTLSGQNRNLRVYACVEPVDRMRLPTWQCPRSRREQGWCCLGRGCALMMLTSRMSHRKTSHCVLRINWFNLIVLTWSAQITVS